MNAPEALIILVDALPYSVAQQMTAFREWDVVLPLRPGFGFSINLDAELFAGLTPDEVGYFNEWTYDPGGSPFPELGWVGSILDMLGSLYPFDRVLHRGIGSLWRRPLGNIPFKQLHLFKPFTIPVWDPDFPRPSLFTEFPQFKIIAAHLVPDARSGLGGRDAAAVDLTLKHIRSGENVFLYLVDLDKVSHHYGTLSPQYATMLEMLNKWIVELSEAFLAEHSDGDIFLLSDHGIADVHHSVSVRLEDVVGRSGPNTYVYFIDSVILRIWSEHQQVLESLHVHLDAAEYGELLTPPERAAGGLTNRAWGNLIFILNEGVVFNPTTYGRGVSQAMHGYHPKYDSQLAVCAYLGKKSAVLSGDSRVHELGTRDVYPILKSVLRM